MKIYSKLIIPFIFFSFLSAQNPEWISYTSGNYISSIGIEGNYIWAGASNGLLRIDKTTHETTLYDHTNSGLPNNNIYTLAIDSLGNKWLGTFGGMAKFDGINWTVYDSSNSSMPQAGVYVIIIDNNDTKWIGTNGSGLVKFDGTHWTVYNKSNSPLPHNVVLSLAIDNVENLWIGTEGAIAKFDGINWTEYPRLSTDGETSLLAEEDGTMWFGTGGSGLAKFDGIKWTVYTSSSSGLSDNHVKTLAQDKLGNLWLGTWGGGLVKFDGIQWTVFNSKNSGLPYNYIDGLTIDSDGNKWIGTYGGGLVVFNQGGVVSVKGNNNGNKLQDDFFLSQNYPNPFNPVTVISYQLPMNSFVSLKVFNAIGREVCSLVNEVKKAGKYTIQFEASNLSSGIYFYRLKAGSYTITKKFVFLK